MGVFVIRARLGEAVYYFKGYVFLHSFQAPAPPPPAPHPARIIRDSVKAPTP